MALTVDSAPDGFRPIGAGQLIYQFTEASVVAKPNYRVEIEFNGLSLPVFEYRPEAGTTDVVIEADIAVPLRSVLALSTDVADRLKNTYVKYQAVWDGGSDAQVPLSSDVIYFYTGTDNLLNHRTVFDITTAGGFFLLPQVPLKVWEGRKVYVDFLKSSTLGITDLIKVVSGASTIINSYAATTALVSEAFDATAGLEEILLSVRVGVWTNRTTENRTWTAVTYGNGLYVAVAATGDANRVMTSPDGITWTIRTAAAADNWVSIAFGGGLFVAVAAATGTVMSSPDGITWTLRTAASANQWAAVTYGNGLFVAVAATGTGDRVMTSPDGITWTARVSAADNSWHGVTYGNSLFVAVSASGTGNRVMTSPDGITWTSRTSAADNQWEAVIYAGLFVAVAETGTGNRVMTSPDGITWTIRVSAADNAWRDLAYSGVTRSIMAVSSAGVMASIDGITWTLGAGASVDQGEGIVAGPDMFVAVGDSGTTNRAMTSPYSLVSLEVEEEEECANPIYLRWLNDYGGLSTWLFDFNQELALNPNLDGRYKTVKVFEKNLTIEQWYALQELNKDGVEYGDNEKLGAFVQDITTIASPVNIFILALNESTETKQRKNQFQAILRYPLLDNIGI